MTSKEAIEKTRRLQQTNIQNIDWLKIQLKSIVDTEMKLRKFAELKPDTDPARYCLMSANLIKKEIDIIRNLYNLN